MPPAPSAAGGRVEAIFFAESFAMTSPQQIDFKSVVFLTKFVDF